MAKSLDGLHPEFRRRVERLLADPDARALGLFVQSAFRSDAYQRMLWLRAVVRYGSPARARKWVAPPGRSNHGPRVYGYGVAVDFGMPGVRAVSGRWPASKMAVMRRLGARYGLVNPMSWENWHWELPASAYGYVTAPAPVSAQEDDDLNAEQDARLTNIENAVARIEANMALVKLIPEVNERTKRFGLDFGRIKRFLKISDGN